MAYFDDLDKNFLFNNGVDNAIIADAQRPAIFEFAHKFFTGIWRDPEVVDGRDDTFGDVLVGFGEFL